jgi:type II secretory pathway pseudopilin PulG
MGNNPLFAKKKFQKGLSLIEASMVLVLSAVVVAGVMVYYQSAQDNNKMEQTLSQTLSLVGGVNGLYAGQSNYGGLNTTTVAQSGAVPDSALDNSGSSVKIVNGFGTNTEAFAMNINSLQTDNTTPANNDGYALVLRGLTKAQCTKVASQKINGSLYATGVVASSTRWDGSHALSISSSKTGNAKLSADVTPAAMAELCNSTITGTSTSADVVFVLK